MKNQYFADINDFWKYAFLRLVASTGLSLLVEWMLTPNDGKRDGKRIQYLKQPGSWRSLDEDLFDALVKCVIKKKRRNVRLAKTRDLIPGAKYHHASIPDDDAGRIRWWRKVRARLRSVQPDVVFFDPDNGLQVKKRSMRKKSKYIMFKEVEKAYKSGGSVLIYQHLSPYGDREEQVAKKITGLRGALPNAHALRAWFNCDIALICLPTKEHEESLGTAFEAMMETFQTKGIRSFDL